MVIGWTVKRVRNSTVDRIEKITSEDVGFDTGLISILDDYDRLINETIVQPEPKLTTKKEVYIKDVVVDKPDDPVIDWFVNHPEEDYKEWSLEEINLLRQKLIEEAQNKLFVHKR